MPCFSVSLLRREWLWAEIGRAVGGSVMARGGIDETTWAVIGINGGDEGWDGGTVVLPLLELTLW